MTERKLFLILTLLAVMAAGLVWSLNGREAATTRGEDALPLAFPKLAQQLTDVRRIVVQDATHTTTLVRKDTGWVSETFGGYPADPAVVRQFLYSVTRLQEIEAKTRNAKLFERLGLTPIDTQGSRATRVQLLDSQGKALADYLQGDAPTAAGEKTSAETQFYLLRTGEEQAWLVRADRRADAEPAAWIAKDLINIDQERVRELTVTPPAGEALTVYRDTPLETAFKIKGLKADDAEKQKAAQPMADALGSLFAFVRFEAVQPKGQVKLQGTPYRVHLVTFDGLSVWVDQYDVSTVGQSGERKAWSVFRAETIPVTDEPADWQAQLKTDERALPLKTRELVEAEAKTINDLGQSWAVRLQEFKADRLRSAPKTLAGPAAEK